MLQHDAHPHRASTHRLKYIQFLNSFLTNSVASVRPLRWSASIDRSYSCAVAACLVATACYVSMLGAPRLCGRYAALCVALVSAASYVARRPA